MPQIAHYGWIPDLPDQRDYQYAAPIEVIGALPANIDLTSACPAVYDQGQLGSCTANAIAGAIEFEQMKQNMPQAFIPSRLFIYYNERVMEGTVNSDSGAQIRDGMKSVGTQGDCPEDMWPYDIANFEEKPTDACYQAALQHKAILYKRVNRTHLDERVSWPPAARSSWLLSMRASESQQVAQTGHTDATARRASDGWPCRAGSWL
jgi:hypothetical protein